MFLRLSLTSKFLSVLFVMLIGCKDEEFTKSKSEAFPTPTAANVNPDKFIDFIHRVKVNVKKIDLTGAEKIENISNEGILTKNTATGAANQAYSFVSWSNIQDIKPVDAFDDLYPTSFLSQLAIDSEFKLKKWKVVDRFDVPEWNLAKMELWVKDSVQASSDTALIFRDFNQQKIEIIYADSEKLLFRDDKLLGFFKLENSKIKFVKYSNTVLLDEIIYKDSSSFITKSKDGNLNKIDVELDKILVGDISFKGFKPVSSAVNQKNNLLISEVDAIIGGLLEKLYVIIDWSASEIKQEELFDTYGIKTQSDKFILIPKDAAKLYFYEMTIGELYKRDIKY